MAFANEFNFCEDFIFGRELGVVVVVIVVVIVVVVIVDANLRLQLGDK